MDRACRSPALLLGEQNEDETTWLMGDSVRFVWVDCGASLAAEEFCRARRPARLPYVQLALPRRETVTKNGNEPDDSVSQAIVLDFSLKTWDPNVHGLRTFLRVSGVLPPPGLWATFYRSWRKPEAEERGRVS